jgi:hypothetical protein
MNQGDSKVDPGDSGGLVSRESSLEEGLKEAKALLKDNDLDRALKLLTRLESRFISGIELFDCLGEVLIRLGNKQEGVHYKTLHTVLQGTFTVAMKDARSSRSPGAGAAAKTESIEKALSSGEQSDEWTGGADEFLPMTAAMAHAFVLQGHIGRALQIYERLLRQNPNDASVREARDQAFRKKQKQELLEVLHRWLANIEQIKSGESALT